MLRQIPIIIMWFSLATFNATAQTTVDVELVQEELAEAYDVGEDDGILGPQTRAAIRAYERDWQLPETGEITNDLIARLNREHPHTRSQWFTLQGRNCVAWKKEPEARETATWSGECVDGKATGSGTLVWQFQVNGETKQSTYEGSYQAGKPHGLGVLTLANGDRYEGEYRDGERHGQGVYTWADGDRYEGEYRNDKQHGRGVLAWADGDRYEGEFRDGESHGQGVYTWADGDRYEGEFRDGKMVNQ